MQLIQMLKYANNPQELLINILKQQMPNNPVTENLLQMIQNGNTSGIEQFAKNLCKEKGINPEQAISELKNIYK